MASNSVAQSSFEETAISLSSNPGDHEIRLLENEIDQALSEFGSLDVDDKKRKNQDIKDMIHYVNGMTSRVEDRRNRIYTSSLQFVAVLLTLCGIILALLRDGQSNQQVLILALAFFMPQVFFAFVIIVIYELQSRFRYPFLKLRKHSNVWKWFYYGNEEILKISRRPVLPSKNENLTTLPYLKGLKVFVDNYRTETLDEEIADNIRQLYLLKVHNYYKNRFYLQLNMIRLWAHAASIVFFVGAFILLLLQ